MREFLEKLFAGKRICLLGMGREGMSSYRLIRNYFPEMPLTLADRNEAIQRQPALESQSGLNQFITGEDYCKGLSSEDIIIKSPGIPPRALPTDLWPRITSQTDLFLQQYNRQAIGVTGTKGKSTTASLVAHLMRNSGRHTLLLGNIGIPPFDRVDEIKGHTCLVMEISSHQLEFLHRGPHIGILLNLYPEHLDHYNTYRDYGLAKLNIGIKQQAGDYFIWNHQNADLAELIRNNGPIPGQQIGFADAEAPGVSLWKHDQQALINPSGKTEILIDHLDGIQLRGTHNQLNAMVAAAASWLAGASIADIRRALPTFEGLEHRIEYVGKYGGIQWYNDSIATVPEACIAAVTALPDTDTLILGGSDNRHLDYHKLYSFLQDKPLRNILFTGEAGKRMMAEANTHLHAVKHLEWIGNYPELVEKARALTTAGKICLLSPAASSYDQFNNFEERGKRFKQLARMCG